jgi:2-amino-4-hydroxy-6-hydroxymethyldihydropteridine diphosphokinase
VIKVEIMNGDLAIIALGSNLGDSPAILLAAMDQLARLSRTPLRRSSLWQSQPVDCPPGSPSFINAVVAMAPPAGETPETLLARLQELETSFGRRPKLILNEPRPLDLDLIAFGPETRSTPSLTLPHPRAHLRAFVLAPLEEILPDLKWPGQILTVRQLLAGLPPEPGLQRLSLPT